MNRETKRIIARETKKFCQNLREKGCDFSMSILFPGDGKHEGLEQMSAKDDHHAMDLINNQTQLWTKLNHKGAK